MILRRTKPETRGSVKQAERLVLECHAGVGIESSHIFNNRTCEHLLCYVATSSSSYVRVFVHWYNSLPILKPVVPNEWWNFSRVPLRSAREHIADELPLNLHEFVARILVLNRWLSRETWSQAIPDPRLILFRAMLCNRARNHPIINAFSLIWYRKLVLALVLPVGRNFTTQNGEKHRKWERCWATAFCWLLFAYSISIVRSLPPSSQARFSSLKKAFYFLSAFQIQFQKKLAVLLFLTS